MGGTNPSGMFDRTPVLLGSRGNFTKICRKPIAVSAVKTVKFLDKIKIRQVIAIEDEIFRTLDLGNPVNRETGCLVKKKKQITNQVSLRA